MPRWENANTRALLGCQGQKWACQDEKMQTIEHFWAAKDKNGLDVETEWPQGSPSIVNLHTTAPDGSDRFLDQPSRLKRLEPLSCWGKLLGKKIYYRNKANMVVGQKQLCTSTCYRIRSILQVAAFLNNPSRILTCGPNAASNVVHMGPIVILNNQRI